MSIKTVSLGAVSLLAAAVFAGPALGDWTGLVWATTVANGFVMLNASVDGDAAAEMEILMSPDLSASQFTASDFLL